MPVGSQQSTLVPQPLPHVAAFERLGFGMFIHWGLYSLLGKGEWAQYVHDIPADEYRKLTERFTAEDYNPRATALLARSAGMRYITLTTRHHDGFSLYDTCGLNEYDAPHSAAKRDLIAEFVEGCRAEGIVPFFYHTTLDWQWRDKRTPELDEAEFDEYLDYLHASVEILCTQYGEIGGLWFDGDWSCPNADWKHERLYGMIRSKQPNAMIINNSGLHAQGAITHPMIDSVTFEQSAAKPIDHRGHEKYVAAEMCQTINHHWGNGHQDLAGKSPSALIEFLCNCRKVRANYLLNIGPTAQGGVADYDRAVLEMVGRWTALNGDAIHDPKPSNVRCQGRDFVLRQDHRCYYFVFDLPMVGNDDVTIGGAANSTRALQNLHGKVKSVRWLDNGENLTFVQDVDAGIAAIELSGYPYGTNLVVRIVELIVEE